MTTQYLLSWYDDNDEVQLRYFKRLDDARQYCRTNLTGHGFSVEEQVYDPDTGDYEPTDNVLADWEVLNV